MKIKDVKCEVYLQEEAEPYLAVPREKRWHILRIVTDDGIEGIGPGNREVTELNIGGIKQAIVGQDPFDRERIWQRLWSLFGHGMHGRHHSSLGILAAVDIALWDIAGKALGVPIYKLMGAYRDKLRVCANSTRLRMPEDYAKEVTSCRERRITAYKLHVNPDIAIQACQATRQAAGNDMVLILDGDGHYDRKEALIVGKTLEGLGFHWFEEPIADYDIEGLAMLKEKLNIPICAAGKIPLWHIFMIPEYLLRGAVDVVRCDVMVSGGITPVKKIADMCDAFGTQCEIHHGRIPTENITNLHLQCAIKNCEFYEWLLPESGDFGLKEYPVLDNEGYIHVPQKPGLGVEIDWESLGELVTSY